MRKRAGLVVLLAAGVAGVANAQTQQISDALDGLRQANLAPRSGTSTTRQKDWIGSCNYQDLPYLGIYSDGVSPAWGGRFDQPHSETCHSTTGIYVDYWRVPAEPGDVFDVAFAGAYNTYLALADYDPNSSAHVEQLATIAGTGSLTGSYLGGWIGFTVPASFTHGYLEIWVAKETSQTQYLIGAVKRSSQPTASCTPSTTSMCLDGGRFRVEADWQKTTGETGHGTAISLTSDTGYFWFFDATNVEMVVKVLDACGLGGHHWVFAGGLTNVAVTLRVTDTQTTSVQTYQNPQGAPFVPIQDTAAFPCQ